MKFSPDLLKAADHCQHRSFITNRYTGQRIAVDCGQCDYCIHKRAQKASTCVTISYEKAMLTMVNSLK